MTNYALMDAPLPATRLGAQWPYSTHDEVSHLVMDDVPVLRARIDQLLEERREWNRANGHGEVLLPPEWRLTPMEHRLVSALLLGQPKRPLAKEYLHRALSGCDEPDTELKIVDVAVCKVRKKLVAFFGEAQTIDTVWAQGYYATEALRSAVG